MLIAAKRLLNGKVFSFEPVHDLCLKLCRNIKLNHFSNVTALQRALAKEKGQLPIYISMDVDIHSSWNEGLSSLFQSDYRDTLVQVVDVTTVDLVVSDLKLIGLMSLKSMLWVLNCRFGRGQNRLLKNFTQGYHGNQPECIEVGRNICQRVSPICHICGKPSELDPP
jgi:FkbM family methyltransferase